MEFILHNGNITRENEFHPGLFWWNEVMQVKVEMWFAQGEIPHFHEQMERLTGMMTILQKTVYPGMTDQQELLRLIKRLINKNKAFMGGWIVCRFLFHGENLQWVISVRPHPDRLFPLNKTGQMGVISPFVKVSGSPLTTYPFFSEPLWKAEELRSLRTMAIFLNDKGLVTETINGNLFFVQKDELITPGSATGCISDIMRSYVLKAGAAAGFRIKESDITPEEMIGMEEIFSVSEGNGFTWIMGIGGKRYMKTATELIWRQVNVTCFSLKNISSGRKILRQNLIFGAIMVRAQNLVQHLIFGAMNVRAQDFAPLHSLPKNINSGTGFPGNSPTSNIVSQLF
jgi:branched-subunit amino acid aminotransferase/4-amino-4-deoxychorismate lyase